MAVHQFLPSSLSHTISQRDVFLYYLRPNLGILNVFLITKIHCHALYSNCKIIYLPKRNTNYKKKEKINTEPVSRGRCIYSKKKKIKWPDVLKTPTAITTERIQQNYMCRYCALSVCLVKDI